MSHDVSELPTEEIAALQLRSIRRRYHKIDETAARALLSSKASTWEPSEVHATHGPHGLIGWIGLGAPRESLWGPAEPQLHIVLDTEVADVFDWAEETLRKMDERLPEAVSARLDPDYGPLIDVLTEIGFGVTKLGLSGSVEDAYDAMRAVDLVDLNALGLSFEPVETHEDVLAKVALRRDYFRAHPEFGWSADGGLAPEDQARIDGYLERALEKRRAAGLGTDFLVVDTDGVVVGGFGFKPTANHPIGGSTMGVNICFSEAIQGRGVGTAAYALMLERAHEMGLDTIRGGTSNPAIIRLSARQNRKLDNWLLRKTEPFLDEKWWDYPPVTR